MTITHFLVLILTALTVAVALVMGAAFGCWEQMDDGEWFPQMKRQPAFQAFELVDYQGNFLPHLLPVDPTLHWANPPGGTTGRDTRPTFTSTPESYTGPVPICTHVHGAVGVGEPVAQMTLLEIGVALIGAAVTAYILGILLNQQQDNAAAWRSEIRRRISDR